MMAVTAGPTAAAARRVSQASTRPPLQQQVGAARVKDLWNLSSAEQKKLQQARRAYSGSCAAGRCRHLPPICRCLTLAAARAGRGQQQSRPRPRRWLAPCWRGRWWPTAGPPAGRGRGGCWGRVGRKVPPGCHRAQVTLSTAGRQSGSTLTLASMERAVKMRPPAMSWAQGEGGQPRKRSAASPTAVVQAAKMATRI